MHPEAAEVNKAILRRLGDAPFTVGGQNMTSLLAKAYDVVDVALRKEVEE